MSRLFALVSAMVLLEGLLFTALGPLLPGFRDEFGLSASQVGLLAAAYAFGALAAAIPAAASSVRLGVKRSAVAGLVLLGGMNMAVATAGSYPVLVGAEFLAGLGAGVMWIAAMTWLIDATPVDRRGEVIGAALGVSAIGEIAGPIVGGVAAAAGRAPTFGCLAAVALTLAGLVLGVSSPVGRPPSLAVRAALGSPGVRAAAGLIAVSMFMLGALLVLGALQLSRLGAGPSTIAAVFIVAAGAGGVLGPVVGRWSDRRGRLLPIRIGLSAGIPVVIAMAVADGRVIACLLLALALVAIRFCLGPAFALLADACDEAGVGTVVTLLIVLPVSSAGAAVGTAGGGVLAQQVGISWTYVAMGTILLFALLAIRNRREVGKVASSASGVF